MTAMMSAFCTVDNRCAIMMAVRPSLAASNACWTTCFIEWNAFSVTISNHILTDKNCCPYIAISINVIGRPTRPAIIVIRIDLSTNVLNYRHNRHKQTFTSVFFHPMVLPTRKCSTENGKDLQQYPCHLSVLSLQFDALKSGHLNWNSCKLIHHLQKISDKKSVRK